MFHIWSKGFKINFQNRKWNYPNRKWNYFSNFQASDQKTPFTKCFTFDPRGSKLIFKTGNGIISPNSLPLIKNLFYWIFLIWSKGFKINFRTRKWNYPNRKWNYFSYFQASNQKLLLQNVSHLIQRVQNQFSKQEMELSKQEMELFLLLLSFW